MHPALRAAERELFLFLRGSNAPPSLVHATWWFVVDSSEYRFCARFADGSERSWRLGDRVIKAAGRMPPPDEFSRECLRLYSRLFEDRVVALQLEDVQRQYETVLLQHGNNAAALLQMRHELLIREEHIRRHHHRPGMEPLAPIPSTANADPRDTLTAEDLFAAMRRFANLAYDFGGHVGSEEANKKGLALLKSWLSPAQRDQYEREQCFEVIGSDTGARYRICHGRQMNVDQLDAEGKKVCGWCFLPEGQLVAGDVMLAQKIALEAFETEALKTANRFEPGLEPGATITATEVRLRGWEPSRWPGVELQVLDDLGAFGTAVLAVDPAT